MHPRRTRTIARLALIALVAAALAVLAPQAAAPVAADGNEAPGAPLAFRSITAGGTHSCGILPSGAVKCWGANSYGQLGQDSTANQGDQAGEMGALPAVNLGAGRTATAVSAGGNHTCALLDNATVKCWGRNNVGQLGQDSTANQGDQAGEMAALPAVNLGAGRTATAVTAGTSHTCALLDNATVKCWGANDFGQLGQGSTASLGDGAGEMAALASVNLGAGRTATAVTAGGDHTCALLDDATVKCWGNNSSGQLGQDSTANLGDQAGEMAGLAAVNLGAGRTATALTAGIGYTCALLDDATVKCWGFGFSGRLGQDSTASLGDGAGEMAGLAPVNLGAGRTATEVTAGIVHTCALLDDATVKCWGGGFNGRLGQDSTTTLGDQAGEMAALPAVNLGAGRTATAVTAGESHTCALLDNANVKCWGANVAGQLGQGSTADLGDQAGEMAALAPIDLVPLSAVLTADESRVDPDGVIHYHLTITAGSAARTGITIADPNAPACVQAVPDLAPGQSHTVDCSYRTSGADYPSRANTATVDTDQTAPVSSNTVTVAVDLPATATAVTVGATHSCALVVNGTVKCWGVNGNGQLGQGSTATLGDQAGEMAALPAVNVGAGRTASAVSAGRLHMCALLDDGTVKCWGNNDSGQLGQGSTTNQGDQAGEMAALPAVNLGAGRTATAVSAGDSHTCALLDDGTVKCWGFNVSGQLGQGSTTQLGDEPGEMAGLPAVNLGAGRTATAVTAGAHHTCALLDDATVKCWGNNSFGQLGQESTNHLGDQSGEMAALPAVNLGAGRTAIAVTAGSLHSCALLDNATVKCWGNDNSGQLGQGRTDNRGDQAGEMAALPAVNLGAGRTATAVNAGSSHTCALLDDGTVKCWGANNAGQLGQGSTATLGDQFGEMAALTAVNLGAGRTATATATATGFQHTCALLDDATVKCWGAGFGGNLGQDSTATLGDEAGEMAALPAVNLGFGSAGPATMSVVLTADETTVVAGGTIHYHLTVTNTGVPALSGFTVTDPNAPDCEQPIAGLAAGAHQTIDCTYTTTGADEGTYANTATVDTAQTAPKVSNTVNVTVTEAPAPALSVVKSADETTVVAGDTVHLHVKVENTGNVALTGVTIDDPNGPDCEAAPFDLAIGDDLTVDCEYVATAGDVPSYKNTASVTSAEVSTPVVSNEVEVAVTAAAPGLSVVVSGDEVSVSPGQVAHFHVVVSNTGNVTLHNVTVADTMVPDCANDGVFDLAVDGFVTIDCQRTMTGNDAGIFEHEASVTADEVTTPVVSNQVNVTVHDAVTVVMTANKSTVAVGSPVVFTIKVKNTSSLQLMTPSVVDEAVPDCVHAPVGAFMQPGQEHTVTCTFVPTADDIGTFSNTATADSNQIVAVTSNQVDVTVEAPAPALTLTQTAAQSEVVAGDSVDLAVTVTNTGNVDLHGVTVTDPSATGCEDGPFTLAVGADYEIECTHVSTGADVPTYENTASVTATELAEAVASNTVSVTVSIPAGDAHVSGTVTEQGSGDPIAGAVAAVLSPVDFSPVAIGTADAAGHFSALAAPGSYYVYVLDPGGDHAAAFHGAPSLVAVSADSTAAADTALASTRGTISGEVTDDGTGDLLAGVLAINVDLESGSLGAGDLTDGDGQYTISGLRPGPKLVEFVDLSGGHRPEFFDDVPTPAGSSVVTVVGASQATADAGLAAQAAPTGGAHLVGQVTSTTGEPLAGVAVFAVHTADFSLGAGVLTDSSGHYDLDLDAGTYKVAFYDPAGAHGFEWFDDEGPNGLVDAATVTATAGTPTTVDTALTPTTGTASGTVTETGTGVLLADVGVFAIDATGTTVAATTTAADGTYTLAGLPAGDHRVRFVDLTGAHTSEYHLDAPDYDGAILVPATAGGATTGIDAALTLTG